MKKSNVTLYARHRATCKNKAKGEFTFGCECPLWLRYSLDGKQHRMPTGTASLTDAGAKRDELQARLNNPRAATAPAEAPQQTSVEKLIGVFLDGKHGEGKTRGVIRRYRTELTRFNRFMAARGKLFPAEITATDLVQFRAQEWDMYVSALTRREVQKRLKGFLRFADVPEKLLKQFKPVKIRRSDLPKPEPFTDAEITAMLAKIPEVFPDARRASRLRALIHTMLAAGLAIRDTMQLERASIKPDNWLEVNRQKTERPATVRLDSSLVAELRDVANGNPKYVFWEGNSAPESAVGAWQRDLRRLMTAAGCYTPGNLTHRFRDTFVDYCYSNGWSTSEIARAIGDREDVVESHYKDWSSLRMRERMAALPVRKFDKMKGDGR